VSTLDKTHPQVLNWLVQMLRQKTFTPEPPGLTTEVDRQMAEQDMPLKRPGFRLTPGTGGIRG